MKTTAAILILIATAIQAPVRTQAPQTRPPDVLISGSASGQGAGSNGPADGLRTYQDLETVETQSAITAFQAANAKLIGGVTAQKLTVAQALAATRTLLNPVRYQSSLAILRKQPQLQTADGLRALAAASLATGKPMLALAALWIAEERWPNNPQVRFDLASLLVWHGSVNEADALLDAIVAGGTLPPQPFGITPQQGVDYLRAYVRMRQGKIDEAIALLRPIVDANPAFGEAALTLALLEAKQGKDARQHFLMGVFRRPVPAHPASPPAGTKADADREGNDAEATTFRLDASQFMDLSSGKPGELPAVKQPVTKEERAQFLDSSLPLARQLSQDSMALGMAREQAAQAWRKKDRSEAQRERLLSIEAMIDPANARMTEIQDLRRARDRALEDKMNTLDRLVDDVGKGQAELMQKYATNLRQACPELNALSDRADGSMRAKVQAVDEATRRLHRVWHQYATALGSLTSDAEFRTFLAADIASRDHVQYQGLVADMAQSASFVKFGAVGAFGCLTYDPRKEALAALDRSEPASCSESDSKTSMGLEAQSSVGLNAAEPTEFSFGAEASCNALSVEASGNFFHTLGVSVEGEIKTDGTMTLYIGPKLTVGSSLGPVTREASTKSGMYVTFDKTEFKDVGFRSVDKVTGKIGALGVNATLSREVGSVNQSLYPGPEVPTRFSNGLSNFDAIRR